jgi:hypothetical protein
MGAVTTFAKPFALPAPKEAMSNTDSGGFPFVDLALARRLERTEATGNAQFVEARRQLFPESRAEWIEVAGAYAMFDTVSSPITQTFGLGVFEKVTADHLKVIEDFFRERGAPTHHEVSPLADVALVTLLNERGYEPFEFTSILFRPISRDIKLAAPRNDRIRVRVAESAEAEMWARTSLRGWSEFVEYADSILELATLNARKAAALPFLAELDGEPIATGAMSIHEGVALLAGASTVPEQRKQGAQLALLESRLRYAAEHGCDLAMIGALPGSISQRNAERHGFRIAYTRIKWRMVERT